MASDHPLIRTRLSVMMFLEFFLWSAWYVPVGAYMNDKLGFTGSQMGWIYATMALGAMISPLLVGYVADRFFSTQRVLGVLHLIGAVCLFYSARQTTFAPLMALLMVNALCFMPTLALVNSVAFRNIDDPDKFSRIAVWGTIGWIVAGLSVGFLLGEGTESFFYLAGGGAVAMGLYSFSLPHTPPKGAEESGGDVLGLGALKLLREPSFLVFAVSVLLISIPLTFYFVWGNAFLAETDSPRPTALMTLAQCSEIVVMLVMPWFIVRIGLKNVLVIGMGAWVIRYLLFGSLSFPLIILGLLLHGFCYCFVFVAAFIYADKKAPPGMSASAQSFIAFLMWGVGMFLGTMLAGFTGEQYPPQRIAALKSTEKGEALLSGLALPEWSGEEPAVSLPEALGSDDENRLSLAVVRELPEATVTLGEFEYIKGDLLNALHQADADGDGVVTRPEWRIAQAHRWPPIWYWPGGLAAVICLLFWIGGRDVKPASQQSAAHAPSR